MFEIMTEVGGPPEPAYIRIRRRYGPHRAGLIRRQILEKRRKGILGLPNRRMSAAQLTELNMATSESDVASKKARDFTSYKDSTDEVEHRLGLRLPRRG